jgi:hypothetical protein
VEKPESSTSRTALAVALTVGIVVALSSIGFVRAAHMNPANQFFTCTNSFACLKAVATGKGYAVLVSRIRGSLTNSAVDFRSERGMTCHLSDEQRRAGRKAGVSSATGSSGVAGEHTGIGYGVFGSSEESDGVHGLTTAGAGSGSGVAGYSTRGGYGVLGNSTGGVGVTGTGFTGARFVATGPGFGVYVDAIRGGTAFAGRSTDGSAADFSSAGEQAYGLIVQSTGAPVGRTTYSTIEAVGRHSNTWIFDGTNSYNHSDTYIDNNGNFFTSGTVTEGQPGLTVHRSVTGKRVTAYLSESASATLEDLGTARLVGGVANVGIERSFAQTIAPSSKYHVFLTPMGDTRGLYVSMKGPAGFQVREAQGGRSTLEFDYRIVARPLDAKNDRLPPAPPVRQPSLRSALPLAEIPRE